MTSFAGSKVLVFGLGRSGLAVSEAVIRRGGQVTVVDEQKPELIAKPQLVDQAKAAGAKVVLGWDQAADFASDFVVVNPAVDHRRSILVDWAKQGKRIWSEVEFAYQISLAPIVAITGTNGKSTTSVMTWLCLKSAGVSAKLCGNLYGSGYPEQALTSVADFSKPDDVLVAEVSSFGLEWVEEFRPRVSGITNITEDHLNRYDGVGEYAMTKRRIYKNQTPDDFVVLRSGDEVSSRDLRLGGPVLVEFDDKAKGVFVEGTTLSFNGRQLDLGETLIRGAHNELNAQQAACMAFSALKTISKSGPPLSPTAEEGVLDGLRLFKPLNNRMELVGEKGGVKVINNSMCTNPAAVEASLRSLDRKAHVLMGGVVKDADFSELSTYLKTTNTKLYLYGRDKDLLSEALDCSSPRVETIREAFNLAALKAEEGEVIILAPGCASFDQFSDFVERGDVFRNIALEWLAQ